MTNLLACSRTWSHLPACARSTEAVTGTLAVTSFVQGSYHGMNLEFKQGVQTYHMSSVLVEISYCS